MAKVQLNNIPQSLKDSALWCCWRLQARAGEDKPTKVPYNPLTGKGAKSNDRTTFARFGQAQMALDMNRYDGLGIGIFDDLCVIDLDHCVDRSGSFTDLSTEIFETMNTYAEMSPSGEGVHIYFRAPGLVYDKEKYYIKNPHNGIEVYVAGSTNRFITVTGDALNDAGVNVRSEQLRQVLDKYMRRESAKKPAAAANIPALRLSMDDVKVVKAASESGNGALFKQLMNGDMTGYKSQNEADLALCNILAFWTTKDAGQMDRIFRTSGLMRPKWDEKRGITTYGAMTINNAICYVGSTYSDYYIERINKDTRPMPIKPKKDGGGMYGW